MNAPISLDAADAPVDTKEVSDIVADAVMRVASPSAANPQEVTEETQITLGLPPTIDVLENVPDTFNGTAFEIRLYGEGCTECGHLVPSCEEKQTTCHFSAGNQFCPAAFTRIVFVGHRQHLLAKLRKAQQAKDVNRILKQLASLENEPLETRQYVLREAGLLSA